MSALGVLDGTNDFLTFYNPPKASNINSGSWLILFGSTYHLVTRPGYRGCQNVHFWESGTALPTF